jgi:arylsulfatase A-like enzyme
LGLSDDHWRKVKAYYYALISHVDDQIGRILRYLDDSGLRDNTLIVFTSDHGEHLGDHGLVQKGPPGLESCAHVPLIVVPPTAHATTDRANATTDRANANGANAAPGRVYAEIIEAVDIAPTILDYCGVQSPPFFQGRSFRPLLQSDGDYEPRTSAYIEFKDPLRSSWKTVRTAAYKYSVYTADGDPSSQRELLFDLQADPHEQRNVARDPAYAEALDDMRRELIRRWFTVEGQYPLRTGAY